MYSVQFEDSSDTCCGGRCRKPTCSSCCVTSCRCCRRCCSRDTVQITLLLVGVAGGAMLGTYLRMTTEAYSQPKLHPREMMYLYFPAEVFLRFLTFIVLPFMVSSIVSGIGETCSH